jgi:hypothetical protein
LKCLSRFASAAPEIVIGTVPVFATSSCETPEFAGSGHRKNFGIGFKDSGQTPVPHFIQNLSLQKQLYRGSDFSVFQGNTVTVGSGHFFKNKNTWQSERSLGSLRKRLNGGNVFLKPFRYTRTIICPKFFTVGTPVPLFRRFKTLSIHLHRRISLSRLFRNTLTAVWGIFRFRNAPAPR